MYDLIKTSLIVLIPFAGMLLAGYYLLKDTGILY
jgi:hypothetical protein